MPSTAAPSTDSFRPDIQALRALAVGVVVVFHLWPDALPGGYVGVDVFFVISGFLITSHLLGEATRTGSLRLLPFWARRAKRLLPASLTVLAVTGVAVLVWVPTALKPDFLAKILAAAVYGENWALAHDAVDYQARENATVPTQHFWSLSAEEQFYIGLPLLMVAALLLLRRATPRRRHLAIGLLLGALTAASLGYALWAVGQSPDSAYFSTLTRAWEFLAGGLLAWLPVGLLTRLPGRGRLLRELVGRGGVGLICVASWHLTGATLMPGRAALLPVVGTAAALAAGAPGLARVGQVAPVAWLGRTSYAVYLWHFPIVIIAPLALGHDLTTAETLAALVATLVVAGLSTRWLEEPMRFSPRLLGAGRRPLTVLAACGVAMAVLVGGCLVASARLHAAEDRRERVAAGVLERDPACLGAAAMDPAQAPCDNPELDGVLVPDPTTAARDDANRAACWGTDAGRARICTLADPPGATRHLLAIGDSHNNTLLDAYAAIGAAEGWRIDASGERGCYLSKATQTAPDAEAARDCAAWNRSVTAYAHSAGIDGVIVTHLSGDGVEAAPGRSAAASLVDGLVAAWRDLPAVPIVAIRDNPTMTRDIVTCVEDAGSSAATECAVPRATALREDGQAAAVARVPNAHLVDLTDLYCTDVCAPVIGHVLVYRDRTHITRTWAATLTPYLQRGIAAALR